LSESFVYLPRSVPLTSGDPFVKLDAFNDGAHRAYALNGLLATASTTSSFRIVPENALRNDHSLASR
jgi:hypothetical protein